MRNLTLLAATLFVCAALSAPRSEAQTVKEFQLVGFTAGTYKGDVGIGGMTLACQAEFPASRFCTYRDITNTVNWPTLPDGSLAWLNQDDLTADGQGATCQFWSWAPDAVPSVGGLTVAVNASAGFTGFGYLEQQACYVPTRVSCCSLLPVPEPPTSMIQGTAVLVVAGLKGLACRS